MNRTELQSAKITAAVRPPARADHVPDRAANRGEQRSLLDKPIPAPTWDHAGSGGGVDDLLAMGHALGADAVRVSAGRIRVRNTTARTSSFRAIAPTKPISAGLTPA
jgi:hypothetical protein